MKDSKHFLIISTVASETSSIRDPRAPEHSIPIASKLGKEKKEMKTCYVKMKITLKDKNKRNELEKKEMLLHGKEKGPFEYIRLLI